MSPIGRNDRPCQLDKIKRFAVLATPGEGWEDRAGRAAGESDHPERRAEKTSKTRRKRPKCSEIHAKYAEKPPKTPGNTRKGAKIAGTSPNSAPLLLHTPYAHVDSIAQTPGAVNPLYTLAPTLPPEGGREGGEPAAADSGLFAAAAASAAALSRRSG